MDASRSRELMARAKRALADERYADAYDEAQNALRLLTLAGRTQQEIAARHLMATCRDRLGDQQGALDLHRENARQGSRLEDTYQRLAFLGERCGDLEAVRMGTQWLQEFAAEFGLVDVKAKRRLERVEKLAAQGRLRKESASAATDQPPTGTGCAALVIAVLTAAVAVLTA